MSAKIAYFGAAHGGSSQLVASDDPHRPLLDPLGESCGIVADAAPAEADARNSPGLGELADGLQGNAEHLGGAFGIDQVGWTWFHRRQRRFAEHLGSLQEPIRLRTPSG